MFPTMLAAPCDAALWIAMLSWLVAESATDPACSYPVLIEADAMVGAAAGCTVTLTVAGADVPPGPVAVIVKLSEPV